MLHRLINLEPRHIVETAIRSQTVFQTRNCFDSFDRNKFFSRLVYLRSTSRTCNPRPWTRPRTWWTSRSTNVDREIRFWQRHATTRHERKYTGQLRTSRGKAWRGPVARLGAARLTTRTERDFARNTPRPVIHLSRAMNHRTTGSNRFHLSRDCTSYVTAFLIYAPSRVTSTKRRAERVAEYVFFSPSCYYRFLSRWKVFLSGPTIENDWAFCVIERDLFPSMEDLRFNLLIELAGMLRWNILMIVERILCGEFFFFSTFNTYRYLINLARIEIC